VWVTAAVLTIVLAFLSAVYRHFPTARCHMRMSLYYASILLAGVLAMFGAVPTYFYNRGAIVAWTCLKWICMLWLDIVIELRGVEKINGPLKQGESNSQIIVSNHQSSLDVLVMSHLAARTCAVMVKSSLAYVPFFNIAAFLSNTIFVNRSNKESAHKAIDQAADTMVSNQLKLWVFPEGTRHHGHGMLEFKKGAFNIAVRAQVPVVPVVISDVEPFYSKGGKFFHSNGLIIAQVMDPIPTKGLGPDDVTALVDRVREEMLKVYEVISEEARDRYATIQAASAPNSSATKKTE